MKKKNHSKPVSTSCKAAVKNIYCGPPKLINRHRFYLFPSPANLPVAADRRQQRQRRTHTAGTAGPCTCRSQSSLAAANAPVTPAPRPPAPSLAVAFHGHRRQTPSKERECVCARSVWQQEQPATFANLQRTIHAWANAGTGRLHWRAKLHCLAGLCSFVCTYRILILRGTRFRSLIAGMLI